MKIALIGASGFVGSAVLVVGGDELLMAEGGPAGITVADLAVAIVDEIEQSKHVRARFTVARL